MKNHLSQPSLSLDDIIEGITDAETIGMDEKSALLREIEAQGGVVRQELWEKIEALFQAEADDAKRLMNEGNQLIASLKSADTKPVDDSAALALVQSAKREQEKEVKDFQAEIATNVLGHIEGMERKALRTEESLKERGNQDEITKLQNSLKQDPSNPQQLSA